MLLPLHGSLGEKQQRVPRIKSVRRAGGELSTERVLSLDVVGGTANSREMGDRPLQFYFHHFWTNVRNVGSN